MYKSDVGFSLHPSCAQGKLINILQVSESVWSDLGKCWHVADEYFS